MDSFQIATLARERQPSLTFSHFTVAEAQKARDFHASFPIYQPTPLTALPNLAQALGVGDIRVKDESFRFGLNAFKVLGGSYAMGRYICLLYTSIRIPRAERILSRLSAPAWALPR